MKIALFTYSTKRRGSVVHTLELAGALQALGNSVCVFGLDKDGRGFEGSLGCDVVLVPARAAAVDLDRLIGQRIQEFVDFEVSMEYDIYHAQDCISANALAILRQSRRIPHFVRTVHHLEDYPSPYLQQCQERSIRAADLCFCVSEVWQAALRSQYHLESPRVFNGVNLEQFSPDKTERDPDLQQRLHLSGSPLYLTVGGIEPRKNSIALLQAFAEVLQAFPNAQLVIAGGASIFDYQTYRAEFFAIANHLNISIGRSLLLPGVIAHEDLAALYRCADAFVFPSLKEGWGLVVLEAIASGLPVITSNQPPFTEFLNSHQAQLVDPLSVSAIAQAMKKVIDPPTAQSLIQASQEILPQYSWQASAQKHLLYYEKLIHDEMTK
ncbi:MAG: MSMEG_0565 family glycosyltransferase [Oculatellaceae cyanobacterium Prado106]|jgi:glycosyltransferase-like protein|nr:MSMEG_0565 family glycosyltransferase [Oculatellaceae cyanobacterium Prado106]